MDSNVVQLYLLVIFFFLTRSTKSDDQVSARLGPSGGFLCVYSSTVSLYDYKASSVTIANSTHIITGDYNTSQLVEGGVISSTSPCTLRGNVTWCDVEMSLIDRACCFWKSLKNCYSPITPTASPPNNTVITSNVNQSNASDTTTVTVKDTTQLQLWPGLFLGIVGLFISRFVLLILVVLAVCAIMKRRVSVPLNNTSPEPRTDSYNSTTTQALSISTVTRRQNSVRQQATSREAVSETEESNEIMQNPFQAFPNHLHSETSKGLPTQCQAVHVQEQQAPYPSTATQETNERNGLSQAVYSSPAYLQLGKGDLVFNSKSNSMVPVNLCENEASTSVQIEPPEDMAVGSDVTTKL